MSKYMQESYIRDAVHYHSGSAEEIHLEELDEVYAKAEAWDDYKKHNLEYGKTYYEITREHIAKEMDITFKKYESGDSE